MSGYRFCRTDDIPLLVDALNRCWHPYFPDEGAMTIARFKREIRDLQVWCSSCMVAFAGADPIGVLIGAKRAGGTLVQRIAVHPDHRRQGHGRHLLTSLSSKLSILGPRRIVAEVPGAAGAAHELFAACGFTVDGSYADFVLDGPAAGSASQQTLPGRLIIPVTIDDLEANGLLGVADPLLCWERQVETLAARRNEVDGIAIATEERIEAYLLYAGAVDHAASADVVGTQVLALRSDVQDEGAVRLRLLLGRLIEQQRRPLRISKVHPEEIPALLLRQTGFRADGVYTRYAAEARGA